MRFTKDFWPVVPWIPGQEKSVYAQDRATIEDGWQRERHRVAMRAQRGYPVSGRRLPAGKVPECVQHCLGDLRTTSFGDAWDHWSPHRSEPSGCHPRDNRQPIMGERPLAFPADERRAVRAIRGLRSADEHREPYSQCVACWPAGPANLVSDGSSQPKAKIAKMTRARRRKCKLAQEMISRARRERRGVPMDRGDSLTDREASILVHSARRASMCGSAVAVLQRRLPAPGMHLERCLAPMRCGLRVCALCSKDRRYDAIARLKGPWTQFLTFTFPHKACSVYHAWRHVSGWVTKLMERVRKAARKPPRQCLEANCISRHNHYEIRSEGRLEYGWAIEPHPDSGYPHIHVVWTAEYACYDWLRRIWMDITGMGLGRIDSRPVRQTGGISDYLAPYITKSVYSDEILAIMHRKKLWASTMRSKEKWEKGYTVLHFMRREASGIDRKEPPFPSDDDDIGVTSLERYWVNTRAHRGVHAKWVLDCGVEEMVNQAMEQEEGRRMLTSEYDILEERLATRRAMAVLSWGVRTSDGFVMVDDVHGMITPRRTLCEVVDNARDGDQLVDFANDVLIV